MQVNFLFIFPVKRHVCCLKLDFTDSRCLHWMEFFMNLVPRKTSLIVVDIFAEYRSWWNTVRITIISINMKTKITFLKVFVQEFDYIFFTAISLTEEYPVTSHFSLAPSFQTMGCFLNKVASSSLVSAFLLVRGLTPTLSSLFGSPSAKGNPYLAQLCHYKFESRLIFVVFIYILNCSL